MTNREWIAHRDKVERFRLMERETTDPFATALLHDIILELEADLRMLTDIEAQRLLMREYGRIAWSAVLE